MSCRFLLLLAAPPALAAAVSGQAISEDFDYGATGQFPPAGWTSVDGGTAPRVWNEASLALVMSGVYMVQIVDAAAHDYSAAGVNCDSRLVSPSIDLRGFAAPRLCFDSDVFWVNFMAHYPGSSHDGQSTIEVSADNGQSWTEVWSETALVNGATAGIEVDLAAWSGLPSVWVAFRYRGSFAHAWSVDTVRLDNGGQPVGPGLALVGSCPGGMQLRATGMTPGGPVVFYAAPAPGATVVQGPTCSGLVLPAASPSRLPLGSQTADANGLVVVSRPASASLCGTLQLGAVDLTACVATGLVAL